MADIEVYERSLKRERAARRAAEQLLEEKSRELYDTLEQLKAATADLREEAEKTQAVFRTAVEGIMTFDEDGRIRSMNPAAECIFFCHASSMVGRSLFELLPSPVEAAKAELPDENWWIDKPRIAVGRRQNGDTFEMELSASRVELKGEWWYTWFVRDISERRNLERQLAMSQRLESVGQLAAGVAHEINTPIQFVGDNLAFLCDAIGSWKDLHGKYQALITEADSFVDLKPLCREINEAADDVQLDFLMEEVPAAIEQSVDGVSRVAQIVRAMKEFSHPGGAARTAVDVNGSLRSTIVVSRNEWKYVAELRTNFDDSLPRIQGYPGDLNQAFLNIIVNAAQAIGEKKQSFETVDAANAAGAAEKDSELETITVSTYQDADDVVIEIADTGPGIPPKILERIFDPFFTTKPMGVGTGQGLGIVHAVVERHGGDLAVQSDEGKGTTFTIRLPIEATVKQAD